MDDPVIPPPCTVPATIPRRRADRREDSPRRLAPQLHTQAYDRLLRTQGGVCAVCHQPEVMLDADGVLLRFTLYYNGLNGVVRGLLCQRCMLGIRLFADSTVLLAKAIAFLAGDPGPAYRVELHGP